jgi:hypothetical protein
MLGGGFFGRNAGTDDECEDVTRRFEGHPGLSAEWFAFPLALDVRCSAALFEQRARASSVAFGATPREVVSPRRFAAKKCLFREKARNAESTGSAGRTETVAGTPCVKVSIVFVT